MNRVECRRHDGIPMWFLLLGACSPLTAYRNSLLVEPPAPPASMGAPIGSDIATFGGYVAVRDLAPLPDVAPAEGDPGVFVPGHALGAHARIGLGKVVEIGGHFDFAESRWATPNAVGVLPLVDERPVYGLGAHVTVGQRFPRVGWGATVDATWLSMPFARYSYVGPAEYLEGDYVAVGDGSEFYELREEGTAHPVRVRATGAMTFPLGPVDLSPGLSICPTFTNVGFTNEKTAAYEGGPPSFIPVLDAGLWVPHLRLGMQAWYASETEEVSGGLDRGWGFRFGLDVVPGNRSPGGPAAPIRAPWMPDPA